MYGIFAVAAATLLLEVAFTRLFSAIFFYHFSFLIISTALLGFGFSGVLLSVLPPEKRSILRNPAFGSLVFALTIPVVLKVILILPLDINRELKTLSDTSWLALRYLFLSIPFFFSGLVVGILLSQFAAAVSKLYFWDLTGAAIGCVLPVLLVPRIGASGAILSAALLAASAAIYFARSEKQTNTFVISCIVFLLSGVLLFRADRWFRIPIDEVMATKHAGFYRISQGIEFSGWSPVSRIDVLKLPGRRVIYIDGGSNVSFMIPFRGNLKKAEPRVNWRSLPYVLTERPNVLIIGPSGGEDVLTALTHGAASITGVELDPLINRLVTGQYREYIGGIYNQPNVKLITDEGRSFISRSDRTFDVIQQVHNISPVAFAAGGMNLSETYLLTEQAMTEYIEHLTDNGFLSINRWGVIRLFSLALSTMERLGFQNPGAHLAILESGRNRGATNNFLMKKTPLTAQDIKRIDDFARLHRYTVAYSPDIAQPENLYVRMLNPAERKKISDTMGIHLFAPTDDRPFFDHFLPLFKMQPAPNRLLGPDLARVVPFRNTGDLVLIGVLLECFVLSTLFLLLPLFVFARKGLLLEGTARHLAYFFSLGIGFILIEIALIQRFILFLGNPTYSIATVLFAVLIASGTGSRASVYLERFSRLMNSRRTAALLVMITSVAVYFLLTALFNTFLGAPLFFRVMLTIAFIWPVAFFLGMPFPLGISFLHRSAPRFIPWAWGMNGFATVLGSAACVAVAIAAGFRAVVFLAIAFYLVALLCAAEPKTNNQ